MIYPRQKNFIQKLIAALKLTGCQTLDISSENLALFIPILEKELESKKIKFSEDELNLLFSKDIDNFYFDFYRILCNIDPLIGEIYEDELNLILNVDLAILLLHDNGEFDKNKMIEIANKMKPMMIKKEKVKVMSNAYN